MAAQAGFSYAHHGFMYGGGIVTGDFNRDGFEDIYLTNGQGQPNQLYLNNGDETFSETGKAAGVADTLEGMGAVCGDVDNDGDLDIYLANHFGENKLFLNNGNAIFSDATISAGVGEGGPGTSAAMADYNNDGFLDIYVLNHSQNGNSYANNLYHNNGNGTFSDVALSAHADDTEGTGLAVGFFDYNNDGYADFYIANEYDRDALYHNNGDGTFTNIANPNTIPSGGGMGVDFSDYDADGDMDIYVSNLYRDFLLENLGGGDFKEVSAARGIENLTMGWGINFLDYDNDGDEDLYVVNGAMIWPSQYPEANVFYRNNGNGYFIERAAETGVDDAGDARASACFDFNNDGYMDIIFLNIARGDIRLYKNNNSVNNWITIKLAGTRSNRDGIGARVAVEAGGRVRVKEVRAGSSYASMHSLELGFGLKQHDRVDKITVFWPSGSEQEIIGIEANQLLTITEPGNRDEQPGTINSFELYQNYPNPFNPETDIPYRLLQPGEVTLEIIDISGKRVMEIKRGFQIPEQYNIRWDGRDKNGNGLASGIFIYRLIHTAENGAISSQAKKLILLH
jgi:hypothetical protein